MLATGVVYLPWIEQLTLSRATSVPSSRRALYQAVGGVRKRAPKLRRASDLSLTSSQLDFAGRLMASQRLLRTRVDRRDTLVEVIRAVHATLEPAEIAGLIIERAAGWVPAPCWAVVSADPSGQLSVLAKRGVSEDTESDVRAVAKWVMHRGEDFSTDDLRSDSRVRATVVGAVLALPLAGRDRRVGALVAFDRAPASQKPKLAPRLLQAVYLLLEPAAMALDSALLLKRAEELSVTDDLTQLYNSRYLNLVLRRETKRASRSGRPLSLLFIDLDGFKAVNDTHGHLSGSRALVEASGLIRGSARETDVVSRFGGDEFAIVLPDTGGEGAFAVGERVRDRVAAHQFLADDGLNLHLTASVGVATHPDVAASAEELVSAADKAMYQVKDSGKNGIQAASAPADN
jgi:diguanylate cyclase (GGDEF)-like protein